MNVKFKKNSEFGNKDNFLIIAFYFLSTYYVCLWNDIPYTEALMVLFRFDESPLDAISYSLPAFVATAAHLFIIFENFALKDNLVFLFDVFQSVNNQRAKKLPNKTILFFLCPLAIFLIVIGMLGPVNTLDGKYQIGTVCKIFSLKESFVKTFYILFRIGSQNFLGFRPGYLLYVVYLAYDWIAGHVYRSL